MALAEISSSNSYQVSRPLTWDAEYSNNNNNNKKLCNDLPDILQAHLEILK